MIAFGPSKWATGAAFKPEAAILNRAYLNWALLTESVPLSAGPGPVLLFSTQQCHDETGTGGMLLKQGESYFSQGQVVAQG